MDTNSETIEGSRVSWKIENEDFFFRDHEMQVESRVVNRPVIALTLVSGILAAVIVLAVIRKRK